MTKLPVRSMRKIRFILTVGVLALFALSALAEEETKNKKVKKPKDYEGFMVFMQDGIYDPVESNFIPPNYQWFHENIAGRTQEQIDQRLREAREYFEQEYGIVFDCGDSTCDGSMLLTESVVDPRNNYRAYIVSGEKQMKKGRLVHDASYRAVVLSPTGTTWYGSYGGPDGTHVPFGTVVEFGEYIIQHNAKPIAKFKLGHPDNLHILWQSEEPIFDTRDDNVKFSYRMFHPALGEGIALGRADIFPVPGTNKIQTSARNVLTWPVQAALGGSAGVEVDVALPE